MPRIWKSKLSLSANTLKTDLSRFYQEDYLRFLEHHSLSLSFTWISALKYLSCWAEQTQSNLRNCFPITILFYFAPLSFICKYSSRHHHHGNETDSTIWTFMLEWRLAKQQTIALQYCFPFLCKMWTFIKEIGVIFMRSVSDLVNNCSIWFFFQKSVVARFFINADDSQWSICCNIVKKDTNWSHTLSDIRCEVIISIRYLAL